MVPSSVFAAAEKPDRIRWIPLFQLGRQGSRASYVGVGQHQAALKPNEVLPGQIYDTAKNGKSCATECCVCACGGRRIGCVASERSGRPTEGARRAGAN